MRTSPPPGITERGVSLAETVEVHRQDAEGCRLVVPTQLVLECLCIRQFGQAVHECVLAELLESLLGFGLSTVTPMATPAVSRW
jgi:hypothetical protein